MPNERTEAVETHHALIRELKGRSAIVAKAVENAHDSRLEDGILYLKYLDHLNNIFARVLTNSEHKPLLDQAASELGIQVVLE
jgi:hypothetical protein